MPLKYRKFEKRHDKAADGDKTTYYVPVDLVNAADEVLADTHDPHSRGYGGSLFKLETTEGTIDEVKGPWHCTMDHDLFNICELKMTKVTIVANANSISYAEWSKIHEMPHTEGTIERRFHMTGDVLYDELDWVMGHYARGDRIAHQLANLRNELIWVHVESKGGGFSHYAEPGGSIHPMSMRSTIKPSDTNLSGEQNRAVFQ